MKALIDTNVILDFLLAREPHYEAAKEIFSLTYQGKIDTYTTASSITDIYYIIAKKLGADAAREALRNLFNLLVIITVDGEDCVLALDLPITDYEDALVTTCAQKTDVDLIITNDADFLNTGNPLVKVVNSTDFICLLNSFGK